MILRATLINLCMVINMLSLWEECSTKLEKIAINTTIQELNYAVNISLKNKYIYVETPKVACSTIKLTLQRTELEDENFIRRNFEDIHNRSYSPLLSLQQIPDFDQLLQNDNYYRFCFVRNPYTRLLSSYLDKIKSIGSNQRTKLISKSKVVNEVSEKDITFEEFVSLIEKQKPFVMDNHWRQQYYCTYQDSISYDFIGRFESYNEDFDIILDKLGASKYYKRESRHQTGSSDLLKNYYTEDLLERVYDLYKIDFDKFGYSSSFPA